MDIIVTVALAKKHEVAGPKKNGESPLRFPTRDDFAFLPQKTDVASTHPKRRGL